MAKNWISSPVGVHFLLNLHKKRAGKCFDILDRVCKDVYNKKEFTIKNKLFLLASDEKKLMSITNNRFNFEKETFSSCQESLAAVKSWVNQYGGFQFKPEIYNSIDAKAFLTNICMYKGTWSSPLVTVHNSFSYTEDIKYEVRILVVRTSDVSFAIVVPNQTDVLNNLVKKLQEEGLSAALTTIQPSFPAACKQLLPNFQFNSIIVLPGLQHEVTQYGRVTVNEIGIDIRVLTCSFVGKRCDKIDLNCPQIYNDCFNFAVLCKDVPIFTGQVLP